MDGITELMYELDIPAKKKHELKLSNTTSENQTASARYAGGKDSATLSGCPIPTGILANADYLDKKQAMYARFHFSIVT